MDSGADGQMSPLEARMIERVDELGIGWSELARRAGVSRPALFKIRSGENQPRTRTRRKLEDALELELGGFEQMERGEKPTPRRGPLPDFSDMPADGDDLGPLNEVLTATVPELSKLARMYAWYEARRTERDKPLVEDEEKFMLWALKIRSERRGIEPSDGSTREVG